MDMLESDFDSTWHYAERSDGEEDCDVRSDGK